MNLNSWAGLAATRLAADSKRRTPNDRRHQVVSVIIAILLATFAIVGLFALLSGH
jgi:hypothetical protein